MTVEDKYYLSDRMLKYVLSNDIKQKKSGTGFRFKLLNDRDYAFAITTKEGGRMTSNFYMDDIGIRRLTPREAWRFMGFDDEDYNKAASANSETQLIKQAGNSIVKDVLVEIIGQMTKGEENNERN